MGNRHSSILRMPQCRAAIQTSPFDTCMLCGCSLSEATKQLAAKRILGRVSEAYGRMLLLDGLFQADGHPGNILVMKGGCCAALRGGPGGCADGCWWVLLQC